jgi:hypothetical protein
MRHSEPVSTCGRTTMNKGTFSLVLVFLLTIPACLAAQVVVDKPAAHAADQANVKTGLMWSIDPPPSPWNLTPSRGAAEFAVTIPADSKIVAAHVTHSTIVDSDTGRGTSLPAGQFHICPANDTPISECTGRIKAPQAAGSSVKTTFWLVIDGDVPDGTFTGNLFIDTEPLTETKTLQLTINHSTHEAKVWGVVTILAGVILAWGITVFARSRINRDQALLPVAVLRQKISDIQAELISTPGALKSCTSNTLQEVKVVLHDLSISNLDQQQLLPPSVPPWVQSTTQATAYQTFLKTESQIADNLNVIATGIQAAANLAATIPPARLPNLQALGQKIDQFSTTLPQPSATLQDQIKVLFDAWNAAPQAQGLDAAAQLLAMPSPSAASVYSIQMEIQTITLLFWAVWGVLSVLIGFTVLVMPAPGFGAAADYIRCSLWGFGLPVAGQGLQTLTMSSLNTQLGVTLPK